MESEQKKFKSQTKSNLHEEFEEAWKMSVWNSCAVEKIEILKKVKKKERKINKY